MIEFKLLEGEIWRNIKNFHKDKYTQHKKANKDNSSRKALKFNFISSPTDVCMLGMRE